MPQIKQYQIIVRFIYDLILEVYKMKEINQKVNLMSALTSLSTLSEKILENSSMKNKEIRKMIESNSRKKAISNK